MGGIWPDATPYLSAGWPWWWLLLLLLLLLLLILLFCCLLWCLQGRYRSRREHRRLVTNGQTVPLLHEEKLEAGSKFVDVHGRGKGDFEEGYMKGWKDASQLGSASVARDRLRTDYADRETGFQEGYAKGLRDGGMSGLSKSMHDLSRRKGTGGFSDGFIQGYRDGQSGIFGDRITPQLISRLEEQYHDQDEFRNGYLEGFREGAASRGGEKRTFEDTRRLQQSLSELTERLTSLEKVKGDEIHSTKIYHVYNQQPEFTGYSSTGQQLAHELEELNTSSRRSTLRRHYTPGDYLKYEDQEGYSSLGRNRRSLSASALGRETTERSRYASGTGSSYITRASQAEKQGTDTYSKRYQYRSRSDVGSPRRYASQTLLDGSRPGPTTPHQRRDALSTLQRELDTLSRSPDRSTPRGYSSDTGYTGYLNESSTVRSRARQAHGYSNYDYETFDGKKEQVKSSSSSSAAHKYAAGASGGVNGATVTTTTTTGTAASRPKDTEVDPQWPDDLLDIVREPMTKTLERMRKYSNSMVNVDEGQSTSAGGVTEHVEEKYHRSYKEEHSSSGQR